ncbi:hypothetical protein ACTFIV_004068 [Dictyostelium citrinum]
MMISATKCSNFGLVQIDNDKITINKNINSINDCSTKTTKSSETSNSIEKELSKCYYDEIKNESYLFQLSINEQPISIEFFCTQYKQLNDDINNNSSNNNNNYYMIYSHRNGTCQSVGNNKFTQLYCIGDKIHEFNCIDKCNVEDNNILNENDNNSNNNCQFVKSYLSNSTNNFNSKSVKPSKLLNNKNQLENSNSSSSSTFNLFLLLLEIIIIINVVNYI